MRLLVIVHARQQRAHASAAMRPGRWQGLQGKRIRRQGQFQPKGPHHRHAAAGRHQRLGL